MVISRKGSLFNGVISMTQKGESGRCTKAGASVASGGVNEHSPAFLSAVRFGEARAPACFDSEVLVASLQVVQADKALACKMSSLAKRTRSASILKVQEALERMECVPASQDRAYQALKRVIHLGPTPRLTLVVLEISRE